MRTLDFSMQAQADTTTWPDSTMAASTQVAFCKFAAIAAKESDIQSFAAKLIS